MQDLSFFLALSGLLFRPSYAAPAPTRTAQDQDVGKRQLLSGLGGAIGDILGGVDGLVDGVIDTIGNVANGNAGGDDPYDTVLDALLGVEVRATPTNVQDAFGGLQAIMTAEPQQPNLYATLAQLVAAGLTPDNPQDLLSFVNGALTGQNSMNNVNLRKPSPKAFPKANARDAPYKVSEAKLRAAIYIPSSFKYGRKGAPQPAVLVPGTGDTGYTTFVGNQIPLLQGSNIADPVWLNIPGYQLNDAQTNAEYVAYAINYIYGISNRRNVAVIGWSQGNIDAQWAFKYWPSTRSRVTDLVAFSPDYRGTTIANLAVAPGEPLPPSLIQQQSDSNFIRTLRSNGGDSAYVPTTNIYSSFIDEVVQPQQGTGASAFLNDARGVGATNAEVQVVCPNQPAGTFYTHEGTLYNPIGFALLKDALAHDGPGLISRIDLAANCPLLLTPGLDLADFLLTENSVAIAGIAILAYQPKVFDEPAIRAYAR